MIRDEVRPEPSHDAATWDVLPLPADAESSTLPKVYVVPDANSSDPVQVTLVSHVRGRTNLRTLEVTAVVLGIVIVVTGLFSAFMQGSDGTAPVVIGVPFLAAGLLLRLVRNARPRTESTVWISTEGLTVSALDGGEYHAAWAEMQSFTRSIARDGRDTVHLRWDLVNGESTDILLGESLDTTELDTALRESLPTRFDGNCDRDTSA